MVPDLEAAGLMFVGKDETGERMEVVELENNPAGHPFYAAAQVRVLLFGSLPRLPQHSLCLFPSRPHPC